MVNTTPQSPQTTSKVDKKDEVTPPDPQENSNRWFPKINFKINWVIILTILGIIVPVWIFKISPYNSRLDTYRSAKAGYHSEHSLACRKDELERLADEAYFAAQRLSLHNQAMPQALTLKLSNALEFGTFSEASAIYNQILEYKRPKGKDEAFDRDWQLIRYIGTKPDYSMRAELLGRLERNATSKNKARLESLVAHINLRETRSRGEDIVLPEKIDPELHMLLGHNPDWYLSGAQRIAYVDLLEGSRKNSRSQCSSFKGNIELLKINSSRVSGDKLLFHEQFDQFSIEGGYPEYVYQRYKILAFHRQQDNADVSATREILISNLDGWPELDHVSLNRAMKFSKKHDLKCNEISDQYLELKSENNYPVKALDRNLAFNCYYAANQTRKAYDLVADTSLYENASESYRNRLLSSRCNVMTLVDIEAYLKDDVCENLSSEASNDQVHQMMWLWHNHKYSELIGHATKVIAESGISEETLIWAFVYRGRSNLAVGNQKIALDDLQEAYRLSRLVDNPSWVRYIIRDIVDIQDYSFTDLARKSWYKLGIDSERRAGSKWNLYLALTGSFANLHSLSENDAAIGPALEAYNLALENKWGYHALLTNSFLSQFQGGELSSENSIRRLSETRKFRTDIQTQFLWDFAEFSDASFSPSNNLSLETKGRELWERYNLSNPKEFLELPEGARSYAFLMLAPLDSKGTESVRNRFCTSPEENIEIQWLCVNLSSWLAATPEAQSQIFNKFLEDSQLFDEGFNEYFLPYNLCISENSSPTMQANCIVRNLNRMEAAGYSGRSSMLKDGLLSACRSANESDKLSKELCPILK